MYKPRFFRARRAALALCGEPDEAAAVGPMAAAVLRRFKARIPAIRARYPSGRRGRLALPIESSTPGCCPQGQYAPERGEVSIQVLDLFIPQQPHRQHFVGQKNASS